MELEPWGIQAGVSRCSTSYFEYLVRFPFYKNSNMNTHALYGENLSLQPLHLSTIFLCITLQLKKIILKKPFYH